jgi:uncharacterized membrane protein
MEPQVRDQLFKALGEIQATQKAILCQLESHFEDDKESFSRIADRIREVEGKINKGLGIVAFIVFITTAFGKWIVDRVI